MSPEPVPDAEQPDPGQTNQPLETSSAYPPVGRPTGIPAPLDERGRLHLPHNRISKGLHLPGEVEIVDPRFPRYARSYLSQAALAMLMVLVFVDSLSEAALAAGLGSSVLIVFLHPGNRSATSRSLIGGHAIALVIGSLASLVWFSPSLQSLAGGSGFFFDLSLALSLGLLILVMAVTDTEHPPAAGTVLGMASQSFAWDTTLIIIGAVLLLVVIQRLLRSYLKDLI